MARNSSLEELFFGIFYAKSSLYEGSRYIESLKREHHRLEENATLGVDLVNGCRVILESLSPHLEDSPVSQNAPKNSTVRELLLQLPDVLLDQDPTYLGSLTSMIKTNRTLLGLGLEHFKLPCVAWKKQFFPALKENATLKRLNLFGCQGLSDDASEALMEMVQSSNTPLEELNLSETGLYHKQPQVDEELRIKQEYRSALRGQPLVSVTSGRLVLCGFAFGGASTSPHGLAHYICFQHSWFCACSLGYKMD